MMNYHIETLPFSIHKKHPNKFDANGVLMSKIPYTQTYHYHATSIASYVIQTGDKSNLEWLLDNMEFDGAIHHSFVFPFYPMKNGWVGGLAQGLTISALAKNNHKKEAKKALSALNKYCYNGRSIEEYPGVEVLNGWIYEIFGIYDIDDKTFFKENINHLKSRLHLYDLGKWSRYDTYHQFPSTPFYHKVHLEQLSALYKLTEDSQFLKILNKWKRYSSFEIKKQMLKRYVMLFNKHGVFKTYKRYKQRKRWLSNECSSSV